jgi:DNA-binding XRE family transcriptional regulator
MAHSSDKYCLLPDNDRRRKLSPTQRQELVELKGQMSQRKAASTFGVSRRTVQFIWHPEKLAENKVKRLERGGWQQYYNKDKHREYMASTRGYKKEMRNE